MLCLTLDIHEYQSDTPFPLHWYRYHSSASSQFGVGAIIVWTLEQIKFLAM